MIGRHTERMDNQRIGEVLLTTPRLLLRSWRSDDLPAFAEHNADPEVMRYLGHVLTGAQSEELASDIQDLFLRRGIGMLPVERRADGAFLGICGVSYTPWYPDDEIGWRFAREHWGRGYATESAAAWMAWASPDWTCRGHLRHRRTECSQHRGDETPGYDLRSRGRTRGRGRALPRCRPFDHRGAVGAGRS